MEKQKVHELVLQQLADSDLAEKSFTWRQVHDAIGGKDGSVRRAVQRLADEGSLVVVGTDEETKGTLYSISDPEAREAIAALFSGDATKAKEYLDKDERVPEKRRVPTAEEKALPFETVGTVTKVNFRLKKRKDTEHKIATLTLETGLLEGATPAEGVTKWESKRWHSLSLGGLTMLGITSKFNGEKDKVEFKGEYHLPEGDEEDGAIAKLLALYQSERDAVQFTVQRKREEKALPFSGNRQ